MHPASPDKERPGTEVTGLDSTGLAPAGGEPTGLAPADGQPAGLAPAGGEPAGLAPAGDAVAAPDHPGSPPAGLYHPGGPPHHPYPWHPGPADALPEGRRRPGRALAAGAATVLTVALFGAPLGLLWAFLAPDVPVVKSEAGAVLVEPQPEEFIAADGWFSLLGVAFGVLTAIAVWRVLRRWRGPLGMVVSVLGSLGASLVAWGLGRQIGLADYHQRLASAPLGEQLAKPPDLRAGGFEWAFDVIPTLQGDVLLAAFSAVVTYTLLAGWSSHPDLGVGSAGAVPGPPAEPVSAADGLSSGWLEPRDPQASPGPPGPGEAGSVRD